MTRRRPLFRLAAAALALLSAVAACGESKSQPAEDGSLRGRRGPQSFPVETQVVQAREVAYSVSAVGTVSAFETVQITARVPGVVERVRFAEGDQVKQGQVLVEVEPQRYELAVRAARAVLAKARAMHAEASAGLQRRTRANAATPGLVREEEIEQFSARASQAAAEEASARVALEQAELNLRDAFVRAPIEGVIQTRSVQTGQYVQAGSELASLLRKEPLLLRFQVPADEAHRLQAGQEARFRVRGRAEPYTATIQLVAGQADPASRLVPVTARIPPEAARELRAGTFAQVNVQVGSPTQSPVIPQSAVRPSERGFLAYVVEDGKARERTVQLGLRTPEGLVEVTEGVSPGEELVVRGAEALRDGVPVQVTKATPSPAAAPAAGADVAPMQVEPPEPRP